MNFNKRVNGSWVDTPHYIHNTSTDTITTLPAVIYANDTTATVGLKGNMEQNGIPTPDNPIMPQGTGERTGNLVDKAWFNNDTHLSTSGLPAAYTGRIATINPIDVSNIDTVTLTFSLGTTGSEFFMYSIFSGNTLIERVAAKTSGDIIDVTNADKLYICLYVSGIITVNDVQWIMLSTGSTPLPYEPYGVKIPISSASTTTPVYLGEVQSTRKIGKVVFTGSADENWNITNNSRVLYLAVSDFLKEQGTICYCTHYKTVNNVSSADDVNDGECTFNDHLNWLYIKDSNYISAQGFKNYLAAQYAAGTPVTIWYVLANPTTGIVNEPLRKIGTYADEVSGITIPTIAGADSFDVLTTLKPSEVTAEFSGWHPVQSVHEKSKNLFDKNSNTTNNNGYTRPGVEVPAGTYSIDNGTPHHVYYRIGYSGIAQQTNPGMKTEGIVASDSLYVWRDANIREDGVMLNTGSTALPYEPYWTNPIKR